MAMGGSGYHSPQFSEDIAWLPPWLQPHQLPMFGDGDKDEQGVSPQVCKNVIPIEEEAIDSGQHGQFFRDHARFSGCRLHLSGNDETPAGSTPSSGNALHFHLHLSSVGVSQPSSSQLSDIPETEKHENNEGSSCKPDPETPGIQNEKFYQHLMEDGGPTHDMFSVGCKPRMSIKPIREPLSKTEQNNRKRFQRKLETCNLRNADINDAVELSVVASEAMVISEMVSSSCHSELLKAKTILEIALHVKHARNQCCLDIEDGPAFSSDEIDETDELCDLDESFMADAFEDVGLLISPLLNSSDNSPRGRKYPDNFCSSDIKKHRILQSNYPCEQNTHVFESLCGDKAETQSKKLKAHEVDTTEAVAQTCGAVATKSKNLPLKPLSVQQTRPSVFLCFGSNTSCLKNKSIARVQEVQNAYPLTANQKGPEEDQAILKGNATNRKNIRGLFNGETSFISESMDVIDDHPIEQRMEAEPEIIGSSSTPCTNIRSFACQENASAHEELMRSTGLSSVDPLCSIVPCSISSDDAFIIYDSNQKKTEEDGEKLMSSKADVKEQISNGKPTAPNFQETSSLRPLAQAEERDLSKKHAKDFDMPSCKQVSSLKPYSMVMPTLNTPKKMAFCYDSVSSLNMGGKIKDLFCNERNTHCFLPNKDDCTVPLKCTDKYVDVDGPKNGNSFGSKVQDSVNEPFPLPEIPHDVFAILGLEHKKVSSPFVLNKKPRLQAYNIILSSAAEEGSLRGFSASKLRKCKSKVSMSEVIHKDQTNSTSLPLRRSPRLCPPNKQGLQNKRVHFLEAKHNIDSPKTGSRLQFRYGLNGSQHRTSKRVNNSTLQHKSGTKKSYNHWTSSHEIDGTEMIFLGLEFLLTGFSSQKRKELEALIRKYGGYVLSNIPACSPDLRGKWKGDPACWKLPIILSPKKVQTTKFLYGCAINTWTLNASWLVDSVQDGSVLSPGKYMTRPVQLPAEEGLRIREPLCFDDHSLIFDQHGGGRVFKSLQQLVQSLKDGKNKLGAILVENEGSVSRHLKHCASEHNLQTVPASWIVNSLFSGKLLPFKKDRYAPLHKIKMPKFPQDESADMSQEI
ncbi:uncharacterized protein LOC103706321 isoform X2 [Phoenix dactylifera]|uniref:Uncharacterized protein LOC103706321 isoform X2 n=1 Tax=Phoenix dactylifera TaxID=42345 RepID=A0A8B8J4F6_PHODC|nr:uncharacterized protein LOC103706321 isoform X2 [Phoenix dactylifera]